MADGYSIKDLPDTSKIEDGRVYLVEGKWLNIIFALLSQLWRGENVGKGPNIRIRQLGTGGYSISGADQSGGTGGGQGGWPFKVYNTSHKSVGQVQINGGDGFVATINGVDATVGGGGYNDQSTGNPPVYPQLPISGNGDVYAYVTLDNDEGTTSVDTVDIQYAGTAPSPDTANPPTYAVLLIATVTGYTVNASGNVQFDVNNTTNTGFAQMSSCNGSVNFW